MFENMMNGMFGPIKEGLCKLSLKGEIAIKTSSGYKTYNVKTGRLVNCQNFAIDVGSGLFFVIPTNKVQRGDIILAGGKPRVVLEVNDKDNEIKTFSYEDSEIKVIVPERHIFMGKQYFYGKIVSLIGNVMKNGGSGNMMKYMMMSKLFGGNANPFGNIGGTSNASGNSIEGMFPMMMMMGAFGGKSNFMEDMFSGMFDADDGIDVKDIDDDNDDDED